LLKFSLKGGGYVLELYIMLILKFSAIIYGRGLLIRFKVMVKFLVISLMFKVNIYGYGLMLMLRFNFMV